MIASLPKEREEAASAYSRYKWWVVGMLWLVCFFNYADRQAITAVFPRLESEFHFTKVQLGLIGSAFMWVYAAGAPLAGFIVDRVGRKRLILGGCLFWSAVTILTGWCGKLWQFVTVRALEGLGETFYFPASLSLMSDYHGPSTRSRALSFHNSSVYIGTVAGSWLGAWIAQKFGWRYGFYFFGGMGILLGLGLLKFLREPIRGAAEEEDAPADLPIAAPEPAAGAVESIREVLAKPTAWILLLVFLGANFVATIFMVWTPTFLVQKFGFDLTSGGLLGTVFIQFASVAGTALAGYMADRLARRMAGGRILVQALGLIFGATFIYLVGSASVVGTLFFAMTGFGFCKGFYDSGIFASLYDVISPRVRGIAAGIMNTVGWGGGALGPLAIGWASMHGRHPVHSSMAQATLLASEMANMSEAIEKCALIYLVCALLLFTAIFFFARRDLARAIPFSKAKASL